MNFLKAYWQNLIVANYIVTPEVLKDYLPKGTELDIWNGNCYVSLVGFMFKNTRVLGIKIPNHVNFEEVNLRFYVKRYENGQWKRGVVFIKEIVPKKAITFVANTIYKEHYETSQMSHLVKLETEILKVNYKWKSPNCKNCIEINAYDFKNSLPENSEAEFILEHYFGYTKYDNHTTYEYEVLHPKWQHYHIKNFKIDVDFADVYGNNFEFLNHIQPTSVFLAEGSEISVGNKRKIENYANAEL